MDLRSRRSGVIIVVVMLAMTLLAVVALAIVSINSSTLKDEVLYESREVAWTAAEAGSRLGLQQLRADKTWTEFDPKTVAMPDGNSTYTVKVFRELDPSPGHGIVVPANMAYIQSIGRTSGGRVCEVGLMVKLDGGTLDYAAVVKENVQIVNDSVVESRDPATDKVLSEAANIVSNSVDPGTITLDTHSRIDGMARPGPNAPASAVDVRNGAQATMGYSPLNQTVPTDSVTPPFTVNLAKDVVVDGADDSITIGGVKLPGLASVTPLPSALGYGKLEIRNGGVLKLISGKYVFDSVMIDNGSVKVAVGDTVEFFSAGTVEIRNGAFVNDSKKPSNMKFSVVSGDVKLDLSNGGSAYYILNAPDSDVSLTNGSKQYGNLVAKNLKIDHSSLFFDPASTGAATSGGSTIPIVKSYQRFDS